MPFQWWLLNLTTGELAAPRCKATNKCERCRTLAARETVEMLALAAVDCPPTIYVVLTCREHVTRADLRRDLEHMRRAARRCWPDWEYFCAIEWQRRKAIHVNLIVRGVPGGECDSLLEVLWRVWQKRHTAVRAAQHAAPIRGVRGVGAYVHKLGEYLSKDDQAAPPGWRGHRSSQTRGYLGRPAAELRPEAALSLRWKRLRAPWLAAGLDGLAAGWRAWEELEPRLTDVWARYTIGLATIPGSAGDLPPVPPANRVQHRERDCAREQAEEVVEGDGRHGQLPMFLLEVARKPTAHWLMS